MNVYLYTIFKRDNFKQNPNHIFNKATNSRGVDDKSIPLAFDIIVRWLLSDVQPIKFKLSGNFLLPLKNHQRNLKSKHWDSKTASFRK